MGSKAKLGLALGIVVLLAAVGWKMWPEAPGPEAPPEAVTAPEPGETLVEGPAEAVREPGRQRGPATGAPGVTLSFFGIVTDPKGAPVEGAVLRLHPKTGDWRTQPPLGEARSDAEGRFEIRGVESPHRIAIAAEALGFYPTSRDPAKPGKEITLSLRWATELHGQVRDATTNEPLAGVFLFGWSFTSMGDIQTDAQGRYRIPAFPVGISVSLHVSRSGYVQKATRVRLTEPESTQLDLFLERGVPLSAEVFDKATGHPIEGAEVVYLGEKRPLARTDAGGRFQIRVADGNNLYLEIEASTYCPLRWYEDFQDVGEPLFRRFPMIKLAWIEGRVVDEDGNAVAGVYVHAENEALPFRRLDLGPEEKKRCQILGSAYYEAHSRRTRASPSDAEGRFLEPVVPTRSPYFVRASHRDYTSGRAGPVSVPTPGHRATVNVVLRKGATIRGRVLRNDRPWRGYVSCRDSTNALQGRASTDAEGRYELRNVRPGQVRVLVSRLFSSRRPLQEVTLTIQKGGVYEQDFALQEALSRISGRVQRAGRPAEGIIVGASRYSREEGYRSFTAKTGADGSFVLDVPPERVYQVVAGRSPAHQTREDVPAGTTGVDFALPTLGKLRLRLLDAATKRPIRGVRTSSRSLTWKESSAATYESVSISDLIAGVDVAGTLELKLPVGSIDLRIHLHEQGYRVEERRGILVTENEAPAPVVAELTRGTEVKLTLTGMRRLTQEDRRKHLFFLLEDRQLAAVHGPYPTQGGPSNIRINGIHMHLGDRALMHQMLRVDDEGKAVVRGLPPGRYSVLVFPADFVLRPASFAVPASGSLAVVIQWAPTSERK